MNFQDFLPSFIFFGKRLKGLLLAVLAMGLAALLISTAIAACAGLLLAGENFRPFTLAVAVGDGDASGGGGAIDNSSDIIGSLLKGGADSNLTGALLAYLAETADVQAYARLVVTPPEEARHLVTTGEAAGALLLPEDFLYSVWRGEKSSPQLLINPARPFETLALSILAESVTGMLASAQQGIYYTQGVYDALAATQPEQDTLIWEINLEYASWVLDRSTMFGAAHVAATGSLSVPQHYLLSALVFFACLAPTVLYPLYAFRRQQGWLERLQSAGCSLSVQALTQVIWGTLAIFFLLGLLVLGLRLAGPIAQSLPAATALDLYGSLGMARLHPALLPSLLLCACFLSCLLFALCNTGSVLTAVTANFLLAALWLLTAGGLIPAVLLPAPVAALSPYSPLAWMRDLLSPLYGLAAPLKAWLCLGLASALLLAGILHLCRRRERRGWQ